MNTRTQFLASLNPLSTLPEDIDPECPICADDLTNPIALCPKHIFCQTCLTKWLTRKQRNCCPTCRRILFALEDNDRWASGVNRTRVLAEVMQHSRLLTDNFDAYSIRASTADIHKAAAEAHRYLAEDSHPRITEGKAVIDKKILGPHVIAMGNMLRAHAHATGRRYSAYQCRDWKLILERVWRLLSTMNGWTFEGDDLVHMAQDFRSATFLCLQEEKLDTRSSRFFERDAALQSPSGDLDCLLGFVVLLCTKVYAQRETERVARRVAQAEALQGESSRFGYALRWTVQRLFDGL